MKKVAIIGGGIAGVSLGILLLKAGFEVTISEREAGLPRKGNAFLMHPDGQAVLNLISGENALDMLPGRFVNKFKQFDQHGTPRKAHDLVPWKCIKRVDLINFLYENFPSENIFTNKSFSHFETNAAGIATSAVFKNDETESADIFIGADGSNSNVRNALFGSTEFTITEVQEIVGVTHYPEFAKTYDGLFNKYLDNVGGRAVGFIPSTENEIVWFMQYDVALATLPNEEPETMRQFCKTVLKDFPFQVQLLLDRNDFNTSYLWRTRDFDPLPTFHKGNVIVIGDAGHLALPFTSAGTTNALIDAQVLATCLSEENDTEPAFQKFYNLRCQTVTEQIYYGRKLKLQFLDPLSFPDLDVPLI